MIGLILFGVGFALGMLAGQGKLIPWVRGIVGKARGVVFGSRPAQTFATGIFAKSPDGNTEIASAQPDIQPDTKLGQFTQTPPKPPITASKAVANVLGFFGGLLTWCARNPIVAVGLVLILAYFVIRPFDLGASKEELRLRAEIAEANTELSERTRERDAAIADAEREAALRQQQINILTAQGHDEIAEATPENETPIDTELSAAWRRSIERLRDNGSEERLGSYSGGPIAAR